MTGRALLVLALLCAACAPVVRTPAEDLRAAVGRDVEVQLHSGQRVILRSPVIQGDSVIGGVVGTGEAQRRVAVALSDVARVREVRLGPVVRIDKDDVNETAGIVFLSAFALFLLAILLPPITIM